MPAIRPAPRDEALALLAGRAIAPGLSPVDEDEERRLRGRPPFRGDVRRWSPWFVDGVAGTAYLGLRRPAAEGGAAVVELVPAARGGGPAPIREGLAAAVELADGPVEVWLRGAGPEELAAAAAVGADVARSMRVLGRSLHDLPAAAAPPDGIGIRPWRPGDDDGVVAVLAAAHPGRAGQWSTDELDRRRSAAWFRPEDLLVADAGAGAGADAGGGLVGVHWMKRRGDGVGEVHNLALHPAGQGRGLGGALLDAGLRHLADVGCEEVLLWVDDANPRAQDLYRSRGFTERCRDVLLRP